MALGSIVRAVCPPPSSAAKVVPVSLCGNWVQIHDDVTANDGGTDGTAITNPGANTQAAVHPFDLGQVGTYVQLSVRYTATRTLTTDPTFNLFGFDESGGADTPFAGVPVPLLTSSLSYIWTLADDATNDPTQGSFKWTLPVTVDMLGCRYLGAFVKTKGVLSGSGAATLWARVL